MKKRSSRREFLKNSAEALGALACSCGSAQTAEPAKPAAQSSGSLAGRVHKAVQLRMLPKNLSYPERFKLARDAGFEYVEGYMVTDPAEATEIKKAADTAGVRIHGVTNGLWEKWPLSSPDASVVRKRLETVRRSLRQSRLYGGTTALVVPGLVTPTVSYSEAWVQSHKSLSSVLSFAAAQREIIAVEEVWNKFLLSPLEFACYVDQFKSPWLKAYFDVGNVMPYGYPQEWIRTLGKRIAKIHLKDYDPKTHKIVNLGEGTVDWHAVRQALLDIRCDGIVTVELAPGPEPYLRDVSERVDKLVLY
ncbi:MAG TPA: sugar phosphate isomerase/epimerase family protein [Terriglobia bacterium]|nr:sugar phosphate isomerase/epimerase family protein [Terriglobia bacterium]